MARALASDPTAYLPREDARLRRTPSSSTPTFKSTLLRSIETAVLSTAPLGPALPAVPRAPLGPALPAVPQGSGVAEVPAHPVGNADAAHSTAPVEHTLPAELQTSTAGPTLPAEPWTAAAAPTLSAETVTATVAPTLPAEPTGLGEAEAAAPGTLSALATAQATPNRETAAVRHRLATRREEAEVAVAPRTTTTSPFPGIALAEAGAEEAGSPPVTLSVPVAVADPPPTTAAHPAEAVHAAAPAAPAVKNAASQSPNALPAWLPWTNTSLIAIMTKRPINRQLSRHHSLLLRGVGRCEHLEAEVALARCGAG